MTENAPDRVWSGIDVSKTIAGALAAVCAAVIGSFLGVAGTLIGAAVASIIGSVFTEVWARSIKRGGAKIQQTVAPAFIKAPAAIGTPEVAAATEDESPSHTVPESPKPQIHWKRVWLIAGAVFVLAMGSLTAFELISGKSVASAVGNSTGASSTVGGLLNPGSGTKATTPAVTTSPTPTVAPTTDSGTTATEAPATGAPTSPADSGGGNSDTTPTTAPATAAPVQSPPAGGSGQDQLGQGGGGQSTPQ